MNKKIIILNIAILIPNLLMVIDIIPLELVWGIALVVSVINFCNTTKKMNLLKYNVILFICSTIGLWIKYWDRKIYGVGFHPEVFDEYILFTKIQTVFLIVITLIEIVLKHLKKERQ